MALLTGGNIANIERVKIVTDETPAKTYVFQTASSAKFEPSLSSGTEQEQRIKNAVLGLIKTPDLVKGYDLTLSDDRLIEEIFALVDGGTWDSTDKEYTGPVAGSEVVRKSFSMYLYTSDRDSDGSAIKYHEWGFTGCKGAPVSGSFGDGSFATNEYKIASRPAQGQPVITMHEIDTLPAVT